MTLLLRADPLLRTRATLAMLTFASFSTLWTSIVLPLRAPPMSLSHTEIGLLGLAGMAGAAAAGFAGRLADQGRADLTTVSALSLLLASWVPIGLLHHSMGALVLGIILLDLAVQAIHVTNQSVIFAGRPEATSRLVGATCCSIRSAVAPARSHPPGCTLSPAGLAWPDWGPPSQRLASCSGCGQRNDRRADWRSTIRRNVRRQNRAAGSPVHRQPRAVEAAGMLR